MRKGYRTTPITCNCYSSQIYCRYAEDVCIYVCVCHTCASTRGVSFAQYHFLIWRLYSKWTFDYLFSSLMIPGRFSVIGSLNLTSLANILKPLSLSFIQQRLNIYVTKKISQAFYLSCQTVWNSKLEKRRHLRLPDSLLCNQWWTGTHFTTYARCRMVTSKSVKTAGERQWKQTI